jgi:two-component system OmpR family sensor kinase
MSRLAIRTRLTLAFTSAVAVVFLIAGTFLYLRLEQSLDAGIDASLHAQAGQVAALVSQADSGLRQGGNTAARSDSFAQVLTAGGRVFDASRQLGGGALLSATQLRAALRHPLELERSVAVRGEPERVRLLATPVSAQGQKLVVVVGASLADRDHALNTLRYELLIGGPAALLVVALAGYLLARAALRPVEALRLETERFSGTDLTQRVTLPQADDEIRRLGGTLNGLLNRLEQSIGHQRQLVADASHELRTPLALLRTELELALRRPRSDGEVRTALRSAAAETERMARLADDLLILARSDDAKLTVARSETPVADILQAVAERFRRRAEEEGRSIVIDDHFQGVADVDAAQIEQALGNLVENALRHGRGTITVGAMRVSDGLRLMVEDEGDGFETEFLPRAFERFSQADRSRTGSGAGLGLAIADAIASAHGGTAVAANRSPHGGCVQLTIPDRPAPPA